MKIKTSFLWFGVALMLISVASAVYGYEVDTGKYRLDMAGVTVESEEQVRLYLINPDFNDFDITDLHTYSVNIDGEKKTGRFSHSLDSELPAVGKLLFGEKTLYRLQAHDLKCNWPITIELHTDKGRLVARYVGIPSCEIEAPRKEGLTKLTHCKAEYYDGALEMTWELLDADEFRSKVKLRKTAGKLKPEEGWYDMGPCPDLESGECKTEINYILFDEEGVHVKLDDKRQGTSVILSSTEEHPCSARDQVEVVTVSQMPSVDDDDREDDLEAGGPGDTGAAQQAETYLIQANHDNDARVCLQGCKAQGNCYDDGTRAKYMGMDVYCKGQNWLVQKDDGRSCTADWECRTGICSAGHCTPERTAVQKESWLTRMLRWIDNLI